jgi:hypothetical protein
MKKLIYSFFAMSLALSGCSGSTGDFEFVISPDTVSAIKAPAISCLAKRTAATGGTTPTADITANYAQIKGMSFSFANDTKTLIINTIEFKLDGYSFTLAGDALLSLNKVWWDKGEAAVGGPSRPWYSNTALTYTPAPEVKIDCPLYLGSLPSGAAYQKSGSATVYGTFEDAAGNVESAQSMGFVTITWRGD